MSPRSDTTYKPYVHTPTGTGWDFVDKSIIRDGKPGLLLAPEFVHFIPQPKRTGAWGIKKEEKPEVVKENFGNPGPFWNKSNDELRQTEELCEACHAEKIPQAVIGYNESYTSLFSISELKIVDDEGDDMKM